MPSITGSGLPSSLLGEVPAGAGAIVLWAFVAACAVVATRLALRAGPLKRLRRRLRTARAARVWERAAVPAPRPLRSRVVVTLTASPDRMISLERTVRTLLNQTCPPDEVHLNIPHVFARSGRAYEIPPWCEALDPRVRLFRTEDLGPATKTVPTVERIPEGDDAVIFVADDDVLYLQGAIEALLREVAADRGKVYGFSGYGFGPAWESELARGRSSVEVIEGWAGYAAHRAAFGSGFAGYVAAANRSPACFRHDDVVVSNWFAMRGVPRVQVDDPSVNRRRMRRLGAQLDYGYLPGALHKESSAAGRARDSAAHLASLGLWRLRSPPDPGGREEACRAALPAGGGTPAT